MDFKTAYYMDSAHGAVHISTLSTNVQDHQSKRPPIHKPLAEITPGKQNRNDEYATTVH